FGLGFIEIWLAVATLFMGKGGAFQREGLDFVGESLGDACVNDIALAALHMVEGNADEASVGWQVRRTPWFVSGFVEHGCRQIPTACGEALPFIVGPLESVSPYYLDRHGILVRHDSRFERAIENSEKKVLGLSAQFLGRLEFFRRGLKERHLLLFFLAL